MSSTPGRNSIEAFTSPSASSPATGYPFPQVYTPHRPSSSHKARTRRVSTASSIHSVGGILDTGPSGNVSATESGRNAISTLIQAPIVRTGLLPHTVPPSSGFKPPTSRDIPPVALTNIPHIENKAFQSYLTQVGSLHDAFQRAKEGGDTASQLFRRDRQDSDTSEIEALLSPRSERPTISRSGSSATFVTTPLESPRPRATPRGQRRPAVTPLSSIPKVYFDQDFHLENPRTFDIVSERSEVVRPPNQGKDATSTGRKALATNAILQEKLSWYMDTVEIHLISSISTASKSFFSALGSLRELHSEAAESVRRIQSVRKDLQRLDSEMALGGLKVVKLKQRRENVRQLKDAVVQLQQIVQSVKDLEGKVENGDFEAAMDDLDDVDRFMAGQSSESSSEGVNLAGGMLRGRIRDLRGVKALEGVLTNMSFLRTRIGKGYESRFLENLIGDLHRHVDSVQPNATLERWGNTFSRVRGSRKGPTELPAFNIVQEEFRRSLESDLKGLGRARSTASAAIAYRAAVLREMKALIRRHLPSSSDDDNESMVSTSTRGGRQLSQQEKSSILARNLRALEAEESQEMFTKIYVGVSESLRRLSMQVKVLLDITSGLGNPLLSAGVRSPARSPNIQGPDTQSTDRSSQNMIQDVQEILDMSSLLGEAVDIVQGQVTKVIKVRADQTSRLSLVDFLHFFSLNRLFVDECEAISGRSGMSLKTVVDGQIKEFIFQFCEHQRQQMVGVMDADKWDAKDFGERENSVLEKVLDGSTKDDSSWSETTMIWLPENLTTAKSNGILTNGNGTAVTRDKIRGATVDEQRYILTDSTLAMLGVIEEFQHLATGLPSLGQETANGLLDCLKIFNSRSSQLILGAGATRSAGLKNITTKHLALASQALSFVIALVPYLREFFRRHLPPNNSIMNEFDKVKRLYQEHQNGIHEKLVEIMSSRATVHVNDMKKIDWEEAAKNTAQPVSRYMETLAKETGTLHKVLAKHLPDMTVSLIMYPVFTSYREQFTKAFQEVSLKSEKGKQRLLADAELFDSRIGKIDGAGDLGQQLMNIINAKPVQASINSSNNNNKTLPRPPESGPPKTDSSSDPPASAAKQQAPPASAEPVADGQGETSKAESTVAAAAEAEDKKPEVNNSTMSDEEKQQTQS